MSEMDKIMRSKLFNHASDLPSGLWDAIEAEIGNEPRKRGFLWMWFAGFGLVLIIASTFAVSTYQRASQASLFSDTTQEENKDTYSKSPIEGFTTSNANENKDRSLVKESKLPLTTESEEKDKGLLPLSNLVSSQSSQSKVASNLPSNLQSPIVQGIPGEELNNDIVKPGLAAPIEEAISNNNATKPEILDGVRPLLDKPKVILSQIALFDIEEKDFPDPLGCPSFSNRYAPNIFVEAYYQPLLAVKQIAPNGGEIGQGYIDLRRNTESQLYSWAAGINIGWISNYDVGAKIGLNFEEINERFMYSDTNAIGSQTIITIDTMFNSDGSFTVSSDTMVQQVTGTEVQNIHNYHRTINLPIHALYQFNFENLALEISGGPEFNISYSNRGKIVNPANEDQWFTNGRSGAYNVFKTRLDVSFSLSIGLMYSVNEKVQLYARPSFRYHPSSISRTSSPFSQRYLNSGIALGARYYFSGNPNY